MNLLCLVTLAALTACSLDGADASAYDKIVSHSRIRAKKEGPNVCALQQVMGTKKKYFSTCRNWYKGSICGKKTITLYECCPGYMKLDGMKGCPAVAPIDNVYETLGMVKATQTQEYADSSKIREELEGKGSFTMFAPSNDAWEQLDPEVKSALERNVNVEMLNALHYHTVNTRLLTKDLKNDMKLTSMYNDLGLLINHYSNGIVTVNCARVLQGNQVSTNGVVHVVDRVVSSVSNTIKDTLEVDDDLTSFSTLALASGVMEKLGEPGHYTLFAPTNAAFDKLGSGYLERIMGNQKIMSALVQYHLLNSVQCGEAIMMGTVYETAEGGSIQIGCDADRLTVNGITMVIKKDIVATNGVIHLIDQVLVPDSAKEVIELVGDSQSIFTDMVAELGLAAALRPETEYTLLAPVNTVFTEEVMRMDQTLLKEILENHILKLKITLSELYNGQQLETLFGNLLRVFIYRTAVCIENACMLRGSKEGSNGALHLMQSLIKPARRTIYQILVADGRFKIFLSLMESAGLREMLEQEGSYTLFAPTDDAFKGLSEEDLRLLTGDVNALRTILLYHFSNGVFINGGLEGGVTNLLKTIQGQNLQVLSVNKSIQVNSVDVPDNDLMATNGVIHVVKNILYPANLPVGREDLLILLRKIIKYIQIKFVSGYSYAEIPLTFFKRTITTTTTTTHFVESVPEVTKVTRVISGDPKVTTVTRVIEGDHSLNTLTEVIEGEPSLTTRTRVIEGKPSVTKVTRVIEGEPSLTTRTRVIKGKPSVSKVTRIIEGEPSLTTRTRVIESEPTVTKVVVQGEPIITHVTRTIEGEPSFTHVTRTIEGEPSITHVTRTIEGEPTITKFTRVIEGEPSITHVTRTIEGEPSITHVTIEGEPSITHVTRTIEGEPSITHVTRTIEGEPSITHVTRTIEGEPTGTKFTRVIQGEPSITHVTRTIEGEPSITHVTRTIEGEPTFTKFTRVIQGEPSITHVTRTIEGEPSITHVTRTIEGEPTFTKFTRVIEGEPSITHVTRTIEGEPSITHVTRTIEGEPTGTKFTRVIQGEPSITHVTRTIEGEPSITHVTIEGEPSITHVTRTIEGEPSITHVTRTIEGEPTFTKFTRVIEGEPSITHVTRTIEGEPSITHVTIEGEPSITHVTRTIEGEPSITHVTRTIEGNPTITKFTRVIETHSGDLDMDGEMKKILDEEVSKIMKSQEEQLTTVLVGGEAGVRRISQPQIINGPDFSKITTIHGDPSLIEAESERISKLIRDGGRPASARRPPTGVRRRMKSRRHIRHRQ